MLFLGLMPDPDALLGDEPLLSLSSWSDRRDVCRTLFAAHRSELLRDFATLRPSASRYSPLAFTFNFPHNLVKGVVVDAALRGTPWPVSLSDLLTAFPQSAEVDFARMALATTLMRYALASPDTIRGRPHPAIVYQSEAGIRAFEKTLERLAALR